MKRDRLTIGWTIAIAIPLIVIARYSLYWTTVRPRATDVDRVLFISCCAAVALLIAASVVVRRRRIRRERSAAGQCAACGYDLRASRDCCPECGTSIALAGGG